MNSQTVEITSAGIRKILNKYTPERAIAEYVWNGFDAKATVVNIDFEIDNAELDTIKNIRITDNGTGICYEELPIKFKKFYESQKRIANENNTEFTRGKNGYGRFTFYKFARFANWETRYSKDAQIMSYDIRIDSDTLKDYTTTEPLVSDDTTTGTCVVFNEISSDISSLFITKTLIPYLKAEFAWFLELKSEYQIYINGQGEAIKDLIKRKEQELADINKEIATTEDEIISRNKRAEAVENEIKRLKELGRTNEKAQEAANKIARQAARTQLDLEKQLSKSILELRQASLEKDLELSRLRFSWERQELENKLKYDKTLTAESREAINQLILNMEERRYKEESEIRQRWSDKEFEEEARNAENRIKMRIKVQEEMDKLSLAQVKNRNYAGLIGDDKDARIKAQQAVANEELRIAQSKYDAISQMDEEQWSAQYGSIQAYEMARLDAENNVQDAIKKTTDLSIASQNQAIKVQLDELAAASSLVGSLRGLFGALGDDLEAFAIAEQALAVAQIIIDAQKATMEAMVASFQLGPIAGPIWFATQKGIITAQAAIASATTLAQAIPSFFSEGGLVTGPGTGTSDSIPAMLSNGEAVMTAQAVNDWGAMLSAMNVASGGNAIQVSNLPQRNDGMRGMKAMIREAMLEMPAPRVAVVDIIKGEKRVKVQNSLGKLGRKKYE